MRGLLLVLVVAFFALPPLPFLSPDYPRSDCRRVLFIGNSLTYVHDIPENTQRIANLLAFGRTLCVERQVVGGATLEWHWNQGETQRLLEQRWDDVVLQEQSDRAYGQPDQMARWVGVYAPRVRQSGARLLLYAIMSNTFSAQDQRSLRVQTARAAQQADALVVPVDEVWSDLLRDDPAAPIFEPDRHHPASYGAYSAALLFARCLAGPMREPSAYMLRGRWPLPMYRLLFGRPDISQAAVEAVSRVVDYHAGACARSGT